MLITQDPYAQQVAHVQSLETENAQLRAQLNGRNVNDIGRNVNNIRRNVRQISTTCQELEYTIGGCAVVGMGRMMLGMYQLTFGMSFVAFAPNWGARQVTNGMGNFGRGMVGMMGFTGPLLRMYDQGRFN